MALFDQNFGNALQHASPLLLAMAGSLGQGQSPFANAAPALLIMRKQRAEAEEKRRKQEQQAYYNALIYGDAGSGTTSSTRSTGTAALPRDMGSDTKPGFFGNTVKSGGNEFDMGRDAISPDEREILAKTLAAEAGGEGLQGMLAAGAVIDNRLKSGKWGKTLRDVIMAPGQFSAWNGVTGYAGGKGAINMDRVRPTEDAYRAADMILAARYEDPTGGALNYYNPNVVQPSWGEKSGGEWNRIGNHTFGNAPEHRNGVRVASRGDTRTDASIAGLMGGIQAEPQGVQMAQASQFGKIIPGQQQSPFVMPQQPRVSTQQGAQNGGISERRIQAILNAPDEYVSPELKRFYADKYNKQKETPDLKSVTLPDGRTVSGFIEKNGEFRPVQLAPGVVLPEAPPELTNSMREYQYAVENDGFTGSLQEWKQSNAKAGAANVTVNPPTIRLPDGTVIGNEIPPGQNPQTTNTPRDPGKMGEKLSEGDVAYLDAERDRARAAEDLESMAERLLVLGPRAGYTGPGGSLVGWLDDAAEAMGGDFTRGDSGSRKAFKAESTNVQLGFADKTKGAISDKEMALFASAATGLATTPEGNKLLAEILRAGSRRVQSRYDFMEKYAARRGSLQGAESAWDAYINGNPMLVEDSAGNLVVNPEGNYLEYLDRPQTIDITPGKIMQMNEKELNDFRGSVGLGSMTDAQRAAYRAQLERLAQ